MTLLSSCWWLPILVICQGKTRVNAFWTAASLSLQPRVPPKQRCELVPLHLEPSSQYLLLASREVFDDSDLPPVPLVLGVALTIAFAAQIWINRLTQGDDGLGAFLRDGRGYSNSGFMFDDDTRAVSSDPMPWLKLPKLGFVEVAGQEDDKLMDQLRTLQQEMESKIGQGDYETANRLKEELEKCLSDNNMRLRAMEDERW